MTRSNKKYLNLDEFAHAIGLSKLEQDLIRHKLKFINYLKSVRLKKHVSQTSLAKTIGTKQPAIARMEAGQVGAVSFDFLIRVALALGVSWKLIQKRSMG